MTYSAGIIIIDALGWSITIMDIAVVLFMVIMAFVGKIKGFVKIVFSLFGTLAVIVGSVLLAGTVGQALVGPIGHFVEEPIAEWMLGLQADGSVTVFTDVLNWGDASVQQAYLPMALAAMGLPATLSGIITDTGIFNSMLEGAGETALIEVLPAGITSIAMTVAAFILLLVVLTIVLFIVRKFFINLTKFRLFGGINSLLGFVLGLAQAYLIVSVLLAVVSYIPAQGIIGVVYQQIDASFVTKFLVEHNWIGNWLITSIFA